MIVYGMMILSEGKECTNDVGTPLENRFSAFLSYIIIWLIRRIRAAFAGTPFGNTREENQP
jgi:hypothetical protein